MFERIYHMDKLREHAEIFNKLLNFKYNIILGRKGILTNLCLTFDKTHFHHLIGLQYLKDMPQLNADRAKVFDQVLNCEITYEHISRSDLFHKIEKRFLVFRYIEELLDSNGLVFKFNNKNHWSHMAAEYILENTIDASNISYICIDKTDSQDEYFCRSFFPKEHVDYTEGHTRYTLLHKEKTNILTQENEIQYNKLNC